MNAIQRLGGTAVILWRTSPYWKWTVVGSGVLTVLVAINGLSGSSESHITRAVPKGPEPIPRDLRSDERLSIYQTVYDAAVTIKEAGRRCEKIADGFRTLNDADKERGSALPSHGKAIDDGGRCQDQIRLSNAHLTALTDAVAAAKIAGTAGAMQTAVDALSALDAFDQSRNRYTLESGAIATARGYPELLAASDARTKSFLAASDNFSGDQSATAYVRLSQAFQQLTDLDRSRMGDAQQSALANAQRATATLRDARSHFGALPDLLSRAESSPSDTTTKQLLAAVAKISGFDQAIASPEQKQLFDQAKAVVLPQAWVMLRQRAAALATNTDAATVQAAAEIYGLLKDAPAGDQAAGSQTLLAKAREAAQRIAASDARLKDLVGAAAGWHSHGASAGQAVLDPLQAINTFDQARFGAAEREAWLTLSKAETILRGSSMGLTAATKDKVVILVEAENPGAERIASALAKRLGDAGFQLTPDSELAALRVAVAVAGTDNAVLDTSGAFVLYYIKAHLEVAATWAGDGSALLVERIDGDGRASDRESARTKALSAAVNAIVARFVGMTEK